MDLFLGWWWYVGFESWWRRVLVVAGRLLIWLGQIGLSIVLDQSLISQSFDFESICSFQKALQLLRLDVHFSAVDVSNQAFDVSVASVSEDNDWVLTGILLQWKSWILQEVLMVNFISSLLIQLMIMYLPWTGHESSRYKPKGWLYAPWWVFPRMIWSRQQSPRRVWGCLVQPRCFSGSCSTWGKSVRLAFCLLLPHPLKKLLIRPFFMSSKPFVPFWWPVFFVWGAAVLQLSAQGASVNCIISCNMTTTEKLRRKEESQ